MKLSVVIPAYNEEASLGIFLPELVREVSKATKNSYEIIIVNDGSTDGTLDIASGLAAKNKHVRVLNLSRNFGKEIALTAGIFQSTGDATLMIDADGQHPPELIPQFIALWEQGNQVVLGVRESNTKEGFIKREGSRLFYKLFNSASDMTLIPRATDFRLIDSVVREEFMQFTERYRITRGIIDWMGFKRAVVPFDAKARLAGKASYKTSQLVKLAFNSFISLSITPLYMIAYVGAVITALSFIIGTVVFIEQIVLGDPYGFDFTGTAMLSLFILFLVGILLTAQGLVSIYMSHIHTQTQNRPLFIVDRKHSVNLGTRQPMR